MGISIETLVAAKKFTSETVLGGGAVVGKNVTISSITPIDGGNRIIFSYTLDNGTTKTSTLDVINGVNGQDGQKGKQGESGKTPVKGIDYFDGKDGKDGYSPTISITDITGGHKVTVTNESGSNSFNVMDGEPFTYDDFTVEQLENLKGTDGISPTVTITEATGRHIVSFTDKDGVKSFVVKDGSALDVENYYTKDEVDTALIGKANADAIPTVPVNVSELNNDENYIKNTVDNLVHYYNKTDIYTKTEVNGLISNIQKLTSQIVDELPTENIDSSVIYLIQIGDTSAYMQHMYINSAWAELGSTQVDLSDYYKKTEIDTKLADKADKTELPTVPTLISAFTNDKGYMTEFTETDPTVPAWAKAENKPSYTAAEVHALPDDTEIPIFTNKTVLDGITAEKVADWNETATDKHIHTNKTVIDKFTESDNGTVLYNGEQIASGNLWYGTKAEYNALTEKDVDTTYVVTDEEDTVASVLIDDTKIDTQSTWSSKKINSYSNDEQIIGTYLDDKIIYRRSLEISLDGELQKTFDFIHQGVTVLEGGEDISIYVNQIMPTADLSSWNIDTMVKVYGHVIDYTDTTKTEKGVDLPYPVTYSAKAYATGWYNYRTKLYTIRVGEQYANRSTAFLTFEYTKN